MALSVLTGANISKALQERNLIAVENAQVTIRDNQGMLKSIFVDEAGTNPLINPFQADNTGQWTVYTSPGNLQITVRLGTSNVIIKQTLPPSRLLDRNTANPSGLVTPDFLGHEIWNTTNSTLWKAVGPSSADWIQITTG